MSTDLVGKTLGEYHIVEQIARGATASVYKAHQPKLNRHVAIKVLSPAYAEDEDFRERFYREAKAVAQLDHPNILPVYDFDQQGELVYIVMQYVDTGSLADAVDRSMPLDLVVKILDQVASALSYAHSRGIVHRDVKPGNILLGQENWVLLTDFGLVKMLEEPATITQPGSGMGTPAYVAPEQATGESVSPRSDVYALTATLYQMITGQVPFQGETAVTVTLKHINEPVTPPREIEPGLPPAVDQVILKGMAKSPDKRYASVDELAAAFRKAALEPATAAGEKARPESTWIRVSRRKKKGSLRTPPLPAPLKLDRVWPRTLVLRSAKRGSSGGLWLAAVGSLLGAGLLMWGLILGVEEIAGR
jgi:serine/threonine protein kinase